MRNTDATMWVILVTLLDVAGWALLALAGSDWLYANSTLFVIHANLFSTRIKAGAIPEVMSMLITFLGSRGVPNTRPINDAINRFLARDGPLSDAATTFCQPIFTGFLPRFCNNWYYAWMGGTLMAGCIGVACLVMLIGCVALYKYSSAPTYSGWQATIGCFSVPPVLLGIGYAGYSLTTQGFGQDEFSEMPGLNMLGGSGLRGMVVTGYMGGLALTLLSVLPILLVSYMGRKQDEEDCEAPMVQSRKHQQPMYGAVPAGMVAVGSAQPGMGMMQPPPGMYQVQVTTEEYTQAVPVQSLGGFPQAQPVQQIAAW